MQLEVNYPQSIKGSWTVRVEVVEVVQVVQVESEGGGRGK